MYRLNFENYIDFIIEFIKKLFNNPNINLIENGEIDSPISAVNIYYIGNEYYFDKIYKKVNGCKPYIIFHTKARFDVEWNNFIELFDMLNNYFSNFKSNYDIYLIGEKNIEQNLEVINNNVNSLYNIISCLKKNCTIFDLTKDGLYSDNNFENFEFELQLMNGAEINIGFGFGGPLSLSLGFTHNTAFYIGNLQSPLFNNCPYVYRDINNFIEKINYYSC